MKVRNPIDAIIGWWNPQAGYARAVARQQLERAYEAASKGDPWRPKRAGASANQDLRADGATLRAKSRSLRQNVSYISSGMDSRSAYGVGTGIVSVFTGPHAEAMNVAWKQHIQVIDADGEGAGGDWGAFQKRCWDCLDTDGEVLIRIRARRPGDNFPVPFQLQAFEVEWLDTTRDTAPDTGNEIVDGIEYNSIGKRVAYWFWTQHPTDTTTRRSLRQESKRIPADQVIHLYEAKRPGQSRGEPRLHAVINRTRDFSIYEDAERARKNLTTRLSVLVSDPGELKGSDAGLGGVAPETDLGTLNSGAVTRLPAGGVTVVDPKDTPGYVSNAKLELQLISRGAGYTYEMATGDMSQANFTQGRMGMLMFRREIEQQQWLVFIPKLIRRVCAEFVKYGAIAGLWPIDARWDVEHTTPRWEYIQPDQEVKADIAEIGQGLSTISDKLRQRGEDPQRVFKQWAEDMATLKASGAWEFMLFLTKGNLPTEQGTTSSEGTGNGNE